MDIDLEYEKDPKRIYAKSFDQVRQLIENPNRFPPFLLEVLIRMIHACGAPSIQNQFTWSNGVSEIAIHALQAGKPILCDCEMVAAGITQRLLPNHNKVIVTLNHEATPALARLYGTTRSAAAIDFWQDYSEGAIVVIGNAPTALFRLMELIIAQKIAPPAVILGFPVGFVGAAESKLALRQLDLGSIGFLSLQGTMGGSAIASAALNALAILSNPSDLPV